jgi:ligand-binding SRPBCC domain-containing protein
MPVFETTQLIKSDKVSCWNFFSDPANLSLITPPEMNFRIRYPDPMPAIYQGLIIRYSVSPLLMIPVQWITEITYVEKYEYFVDNQVKGPFKSWQHQHFFKVVPEGIEMRDIVTYELPLGKLGELVGLWIVRKRVEGIFKHRKSVIDKYFG